MNSLSHPLPKESPNMQHRRTSGAHALSSRVLLAVLAVASFLFLALELRSPFYFLQDDGLEAFLPYYVHNWRSLLACKLPLYDFHIYAGVPHMAVGQTGVFYVPQYLAMFLSESIWGHPFAMLDVMAFMHALIAVAGGYVLLRYMGAADMAAAFGALSAFTGFFVWAGRMWPIALMLCAWFPWMLWASLRYIEKPSAARAGWLMLFRLALLFGGQSQFFVLAMIFEHLFALGHALAIRRQGWKARGLGYLLLDVPTALLGLPFLLPVWMEAGRSYTRSTHLSYAEFSVLSLSPIFWLFGQLFVFMKVELPKHIVIARSIPYVSYIGYLPALLPLGAGMLWKKRPGSRPWLFACGVCFVIALLWCWNAIGPLIYHLPVLNRFRWPFKLIYFAGFFQCLVAALVLTLFSRRWQRIAVAVFLVNWIVVFCLLPGHAWRVRKYQVPLKSPWQEVLKDGRYLVISQGSVRTVSKEFVERDYAEIWGLDNLLGYEPLVPRLNATLLVGRSLTEWEIYGGNYMGTVDPSLLSHLKLWSVRYVLVDPGRSDISKELEGTGYQVQAVKQGWTLWKDPSALPRVRWGDASADAGAAAGIHWVEHVNSIDVDLSQWPGRELVFAFVANHGLETCLGESCSPVGNSADGLVRVEVPPGTRHVRLVYHNALLLPSGIIALVTLMVYGLWLFRSRSANRRASEEHTSVSPVSTGHDGQ
ncbi:MAG: hypothetical protein EPN47_10050 [Acidobacteria bacterium]|nr:MAG: hypothetical protein EPN47_10050 [Acidobacteriota bacterium]